MSLTVLLPTLGRPTLTAAVQSVVEQTVPCGLIVKRDLQGIGPGPMLNSMLPQVDTTWVHTLGDDDTLEPRFAEMVAAQDQSADLIVFQMRYIDGRVLPCVTDPSELEFGYVGCSYAVKTEVARRVGWVDHPLKAEDWEMISAVREGGGVIRMFPEVMYHVRPAGDDR